MNVERREALVVAELDLREAHITLRNALRACTSQEAEPIEQVNRWRAVDRAYDAWMTARTTYAAVRFPTPAP